MNTLSLRLAPLALSVLATPAFAQAPAAPKIDAGDTAWMIAATALVLMMTLPGLALFYCGMVRKKNVLATMAQSVVSVALVSILWAVLGYTLAFSGDAPALGNLDRIFLRGIGMDSISSLATTIPESLFMIYQMTFAIITVALVAGAVADRMRFSAFLLFTVAVAVHRLRAARALGLGRRLPPKIRRARFRRRHRGAHQCRCRGTCRGARARQAARLRHGKPRALTTSSLAVIGTGLLWVGWFGFNGGSALGPSRAVMAIVVDASCGLRGRAHLDGARMDATAANRPCSA